MKIEEKNSIISKLFGEKNANQMKLIRNEELDWKTTIIYFFIFFVVIVIVHGFLFYTENSKTKVFPSSIIGVIDIDTQRLNLEKALNLFRDKERLYSEHSQNIINVIDPSL